MLILGLLYSSLGEAYKVCYLTLLAHLQAIKQYGFAASAAKIKRNFDDTLTHYHYETTSHPWRRPKSHHRLHR